MRANRNFAYPSKLLTQSCLCLKHFDFFMKTMNEHGSRKRHAYLQPHISPWQQSKAEIWTERTLLQDLPLIMPLKASSTKVIDIKSAIISSVDLWKNSMN